MSSDFVSAREALNYNTQMANSAHQREVKDLQAAGLNPVLSAKFGGAATPSVSASSGVSGGGGGSVSVEEQGRPGLLGAYVDSLSDNGSIKIFGIPIPNKFIKTMYDRGAQTLESLAACVSDLIGKDVSEINFLNILSRESDDDRSESGYSSYVGDYSAKNIDSEVSAAAAGIDAGTDGYLAPVGNSAYRNAQSKYADSQFESWLGALNPRLLDMYWHVTGQDYKRKKSESHSR